jgi:hypothetical protein
LNGPDCPSLGHSVCNLATTAALKAALPRFSREAEFGATLLALLATAADVNSSAGADAAAADTLLRTRNAVLGVGQIALWIDDRHVMGAVAMSLGHTCVTALCREPPHHPVLTHAWLTCAQHLTQAFADELAPVLPMILPSVVRMIAQFGTQADAELPLVHRAIDFLRIVLASCAPLVRPHATPLFVALCNLFARISAALQPSEVCIGCRRHYNCCYFIYLFIYLFIYCLSTCLFFHLF